MESRTQAMLEDPGVYSIANWLTMGLLDLAEGALNPNKPLSLEHWLNSLGLASALFGMYEAAKQAIALRKDNTTSSGRVDADRDDSHLEGKSGSKGWDMTEGGGKINAPEYSQHAMERMAPDTPSVRAELSRRAEKLAEAKGFKAGTDEYYQFCKKYVNPKNISPGVIEDAINSIKGVPGNTEGTFVHETADVKVIVNSSGKVVTVIPK